MKRRSVLGTGLSGLAGLAGLGGLAGCDDQAPPLKELVLATGTSGGVYQQLGAALADEARVRWGVATSVRATGAAVDNLNLLAAHKVNLGFTTVDTAALALTGRSPFSRRLPIMALAGLYDDYMQIVVRQDSTITINSLTDMPGRRVSIGAPQSGTEVIALRLLAIAGIPLSSLTVSRLGVNDSANALASGQIDAFFFSGGLPTPAITGLVYRSAQVRFLSLDSYLKPMQDQYGEVYQQRSIPNSAYNAYGLPALTFGIPNILAVSSDMSKETARRLTALLFQAKPRLVNAHQDAHQLDPRSALSTYPVKLHPGAEEYYRQVKLD